MSKNVILVVSFGTSFNDNRIATIDKMEDDVRREYPDWEVRRAWTSYRIVSKIQKRDNIHIDTIDEAIERLEKDDVDRIVVLTTYVIPGEEYDLVADKIKNSPIAGKTVITRPILTYEEDYDEALTVIDEIVEENNIPKDSALVLMGHGTEHQSNANYCELALKLLLDDERNNVYLTTVEGFPTFTDTIRLMEGKGYTSVVLTPFMNVAGDHANNDMASDEEDSLRSVMESNGYKVDCIIKGLMEYPGFRRLFLNRLKDAME